MRRTLFLAMVLALLDTSALYSRVAVDCALSVQYQQASSGTTPSPMRVADFRLG
ncbi:hypothetical protein SAMN05216266_12610 [Amycolatopsis marina]|uniref:Uncharacterized protein n=1 Tax=Amycolatopsis marina TaxID=490629 RepID=A0A1I1CIA0_9PSEU|nr:hypothetical protein [Amycolatopsis marina]SFB60628.1 hypothetical protein SAMN05216266_12610 [Amycolatopsis marina]